MGLKRHNFDLELRKALSAAFKLTFRSGLHLDEALLRIEKEVPSSPAIEHWLEFARTSKRGLIGLRGMSQLIESDDLLEQ